MRRVLTTTAIAALTIGAFTPAVLSHPHPVPVTTTPTPTPTGAPTTAAVLKPDTEPVTTPVTEPVPTPGAEPVTTPGEVAKPSPVPEAAPPEIVPTAVAPRPRKPRSRITVTKTVYVRQPMTRIVVQPVPQPAPQPIAQPIVQPQVQPQVPQAMDAPTVLSRERLTHPPVNGPPSLSMLSSSANGDRGSWLTALAIVIVGQAALLWFTATLGVWRRKLSLNNGYRLPRPLNGLRRTVPRLVRAVRRR